MEWEVLRAPSDFGGLVRRADCLVGSDNTAE